MRTDCIVMGVVLVVVAGGCSKSPNAATDGGAAGAKHGRTPDSGAVAGMAGRAQDAGLIVSDGGGLSIIGGTGGCKRIGCSGQSCVEASDPGIISICAARPEYACYQQAQCGRQADGKCGFTSSQRFSDCLARAADGGSSLSWYETCGAAVCTSGSMNDPNIPDCTTEIAGRPCTARDALCDLLNHCGTHLQCTDHDPTSDGCPHG